MFRVTYLGKDCQSLVNKDFNCVLEIFVILEHTLRVIISDTILKIQSLLFSSPPPYPAWKSTPLKLQTSSMPQGFFPLAVLAFWHHLEANFAVNYLYPRVSVRLVNECTQQRTEYLAVLPPPKGSWSSPFPFPTFNTPQFSAHLHKT